MIRRLVAVDTKSTDDSDFSGLAVCRARRILSWFGDSVTFNILSATTELVDVLSLPFIALM